MHRVAFGPGPATKLGAAVVLHGLHDFLLGVHHKGAVLRHGLANRAALQQQAFHGRGAGVDQFPVLRSNHFQRRVVADGLRAHRKAVAHKVIQHAARALAGGGGQSPACTGLQVQRPDGHVAFRLGCPGLGRRAQRCVCTGQRASHHGHGGQVAACVAVLKNHASSKTRLS